MKKGKNAFLCLLGILTLALSACGSIKGEYTQLEAPFNTGSSSVSVPNDVPASSEPETSSDTPTADVKAEPLPEELVRVRDYIPDIKVDIKYATADNFTGCKIYDFDDAYLRYGTVKKLKKAADTLREKGYLLLIWDGYRPVEAQFTLFENAPDPTYVADPNKKYSSHSNGGTVDISIVKADGSSVTMPTDFDDFTDKADRDYSDVSAEAAANSELLEKAMTAAGFKGYSKEWWHYSDTDSYGYDDIKGTRLAKRSKTVYTADCESYISLRKSPESDSEVLCKIPSGAEMKPYCWFGKYIGVVYGEYVGYVSSGYVK